MESEKSIFKLLKEKASVKQQVYRITKQKFAHLQEILSQKAINLNAKFPDPDVNISYEE